MGTFRIEVEFANPSTPGRRASLQDVLVDTGAELSWFPAAVLELLGIRREKEASFRQANGTILTRFTGFAIIFAAGTRTIDEVVFGQPDDLMLLGARSLEGLNVRIDPIAKALVDAGPAPAAAAA
jgi:predicted aspartyl protease